MTFKPGTELDRLIGQKIFNQRLCKREHEDLWTLIEGEPGVPVGYMNGDNSHSKWRTAFWQSTEEGAWSHTPQYSTTWSGMQLVVEEMQRRGWDYLASSLVNGNHAMRFDHYTIVHGQEVENSTRAEAPTLPHAACLAALKALGALEKGENNNVASEV